MSVSFRRTNTHWLFGYQKEWLRWDLIAGLITAAVVTPKAMAYATIAGLPVQVGLYTVLVPMAIYAMFGTSRPLSVSTTTTLAILAAAAFSRVAVAGDPTSLMKASTTLTLLVGAILLLAALLRLGFVANFISEPVLIGFKAGIAFVIVLDQIPKLLGVHIAKGNFVHNLVATIQAVPHMSLPTLVVGIVMIASLIAIARIFPRAPAPLIVVAIGIASVRLFGLQNYGVETVGRIPQGLPSFTSPDISLAAQLWPAALGIALMSFTETIAAGRAFAKSDEPRLRPNQELAATGLANIGGALFGAMPAGGGTTQTAVNRLAGARTQLAELVTAAVALLTMLYLAPLITLMPQATLAAVVIVYSIVLIKPADFRLILQIRRTEFFWALIALAGVILLGTLQGILVAIVVSLVALAFQTADPPVRELGRKPGTNVFRPLSKEHPHDETFAGLLIIQLEGRVFFVNAERIGEKMKALADQAHSKTNVVAIDLSGVPDLEYTALKMLIEAERRERERGVSVWLIGLNPEVLSVIQRSSLGEVLGRERMHFNLELAIAKYLANPPTEKAM
jgi:SulP family sulfate permease